MKLVLVSTINNKNDEGMKNVAKGISLGFQQLENVDLLCLKARDVINPFKLRKIKKCDRVLICLRANKRVYKLCRFIHFFNKNISLILCQPPTNEFIKLANKNNIFSKNITLDNKSAFSFDALCINYPIDTNRFHPIGEKNSHSRVLSVGHLTNGRNMSDFLMIDESFEKTFVSSINHDDEIKKTLENGGVKVIEQYIPNIEKVYQENDIYFFPTIDLNFVISIPLSVLEAAACGLPVVMNSAFPALDLLKKYVSEEGLFFYSDTESLSKAMTDAVSFTKNNKQNKLLLFSSWKIEADKIFNFFKGDSYVS